MTVRRILVLGDGEYDLGPALGKESGPEGLFALPRLVHRLLGDPRDVAYTCQRFPTIPPVHGRGAKYTRKAQSAIRQAAQQRYHAITIVIDRDRKRDAKTIVPLRQGRDALEHTAFPPCAVGMAVEAFDAWMIADGKAIKAAGGDPTRGHPAPENLDGNEGTGGHPKDVAAQVFSGKGGLAANYAAVAEHADLALLARACPQGFEPFAEEIRERIAPVVA